MPVFNFKAKDQQGKILKGIVEAKDQNGAVSLLHERQLLVINLKVKGEGIISTFSRRFRRVSFTDIVNFTRQVATMFTAGLRLTESLRILEKQTENPAMHKVITELRTDIEGGASFAGALEKQSCFPKVYVAVVKSGEASGKLDSVLGQLADGLEKQRALRARIKGALIYPAVVLAAMGALVFILMTWVIPGLTSIYEAFEADLPPATKLLIAISKFMSVFWWLVIIAMIGLVFLYKAWRRTSLGKKQGDAFFLRLPILGKLQKETVMTEFCRTLALLASAGVPLIDGLNIVSDTVDNVVYREAIREAAQRVEKGFPLSMVLESNPLFPAIVVQMTKVGEETGKIDETLMRVATYFEVETDEMVKALTTLIEPLMMVILGVGVGFMVYSIIMPIYNLVGSF